jgi:hypothetical protein
MKVLVHAKQQTRRSKAALMAHANLVCTLKRIKDAAGVAQMTRGAFIEALARPMYYRLNADKSVSPIYGRLGDENSAVMEWAREFEKSDTRIVAHDDVDGRLVSTVFLGLDHGFGSGPPVLFVTMVFSNETKTFKWSTHEREYHEELDQRRYCTWAEAVAGHAEILAETRAIVARLNAIVKPGGAE